MTKKYNYKKLIIDFYNKNRRMPSYREMDVMFGYTGNYADTSRRIVRGLAEQGFIKMMPCGKYKKPAPGNWFVPAKYIK